VNSLRDNWLAVSTNYLRFGTGMVAVLLVTPLCVRVLGAHGFGLWSLAVACIGLVGLLEAGLATTALRFAGHAEGGGRAADRNRYLSSLLVVALPVGALIALAAWGLAPFLAALLSMEGTDSPEFVMLVRCGGLALGAALPGGLWRAALVARGDLPLSNVIETVAIVAGSSVTAACLVSGAGVGSMVAGFAVTTLLPAMAYVPAAHWRSRSLRVWPRHGSWRALKEMRGFAGAATVANSANLAALRCEPVVVKAFLPVAMVGHYAVSARMTEYLLMLAKQFSNALTPAIARAHGGDDPAEVRRILLAGTASLFALTALGASLAGLQAPALLTTWLGNEFAAAAPALRWLLAAAVVSSLSINAAGVLGMTGHHRSVAAASALTATLRLTAGAMLIGRMGLEGPGIAALCSAAGVELMLVLRRACRLHDVRLAEFITVPLLPGLAGLTAFWSLAWLLEGWTSGPGWSGIVLRSSVLAVAFVVVALAFSPLAPWRHPGAEPRRLPTAALGVQP
jgi:O-antigen/teichoic acid export membrane protein